jgi:hypothetical protein
MGDDMLHMNMGSLLDLCEELHERVTTLEKRYDLFGGQEFEGKFDYDGQVRVVFEIQNIYGDRELTTGYVPNGGKTSFTGRDFKNWVEDTYHKKINSEKPEWFTDIRKSANIDEQVKSISVRWKRTKKGVQRKPLSTDYTYIASEIEEINVIFFEATKTSYKRYKEMKFDLDGEQVMQPKTMNQTPGNFSQVKYIANERVDAYNETHKNKQIAISTIVIHYLNSNKDRSFGPEPDRDNDRTVINATQLQDIVVHCKLMD